MRNLYHAATQRWGSVDLVTQATKPVEKLTVKQAAAHYGVSVATIYRRVRAGRIIATKNARGHWEILNNGTTLATAEMATDIRNRMIARNELDRQPAQGPRVAPCAADDFYAGMQARRRTAIAAQRQLTAASAARRWQAATLIELTRNAGGAA